MTIARIETFNVAPRWLFVRIETNDGHVGWGEASLEGHSDAVRAVLHQCAEYLIGTPAHTIEDHWRVLSKSGFYRGGPILASAVSGIDQALWDLAGKRLGVPVHHLLGGPVRERIRMYGWVGGDEPQQVEDAIAAQLQHGLTAVKMNASGRLSPNASAQEVNQIIARVAAARNVLGPERDVAIDFHGRATAATVRRIAPLLEEYHPFFLEEPVTPEHTHLIGDIVRGTATPIATGERLYSKEEFLPAFQAGVAIAQPDLSHAGGISEVRRIATLADTFGAQLAPHCPLGPLALAACLQVGFATSNYLIQEQSIGIHYNRDAELLDYVLDRAPFRFVNGHIERLRAPGLGVSIDEDAVRAADRRGASWRTPLWRHADGSVAEW